MQLYQVGPDSLSEWDFEQIKDKTYQWFVYWYEDGGYDGSGLGVGMNEDGMLSYGDLGHCSCYGPMEHFPEATVSVDEFLRLLTNDPAVPGRERSKEDYDFARWAEVGEKVRELVTMTLQPAN